MSDDDLKVKILRSCLNDDVDDVDDVDDDEEADDAKVGDLWRPVERGIKVSTPFCVWHRKW